MLTSLHIENVALIKELDVDFSEGFTVFTGETGAGKSIIIDSIRLLLGSRADGELIRRGQSFAQVSALFSQIDEKTKKILAENELSSDENGEIVISRRIETGGKSRAKISGRTVPLSLLKQVGDTLIAIHSQFDSIELLSRDEHIKYLDSYADIQNELDEYKAVYAQMNDCKNALKEEARLFREYTASAPMMKLGLKEIKDAGISENEEKKLDERRILLKGSEKLIKNVSVISKTIKGAENAPGALGLIKMAESALSKISENVDGGDTYLARLSEISIELDSMADDIRKSSGVGFTDDVQGEIARIEERLSVIDKLTRKYGDISEYKSNAEKVLSSLDVSADKCEELKNKLSKLSQKAFALSGELSKKRRNAASELEKAVMTELSYLDLEKVTFKVSVENEMLREGTPKLSSDGCDLVEFLISPNVGEGMKPLAKIASGGEASRIMLALRCVFADKYGIPSMIFDEIDSGISGKTSEKIGIKMQKIASAGGTQVFCVTHSAQVASCADEHLKIEKHEQDGRTETSVCKLGEKERIEELSRIIGGIEITESVRKSAEELILKNKRK